MRVPLKLFQSLLTWFLNVFFFLFQSTRWGTLFSTGGHMICEKLKCHSFPEGLIYKRLVVIVHFFSYLAQANVHLKKKYDILLKNQLWAHVSWKQGRNSKIPIKLLEKQCSKVISKIWEGVIGYDVKHYRRLPKILESNVSFYGN